MALDIPLKGSKAMDGNEQELFVQNGLKQYETKIFSDLLEAGDEIVIRTYIQDEQAVSRKKYRTTNIEGPQGDPATIINWVATSSYRVTVQQISGTFRTITWALFTA